MHHLVGLDHPRRRQSGPVRVGGFARARLGVRGQPRHPLLNLGVVEVPQLGLAPRP